MHPPAFPCSTELIRNAAGLSDGPGAQTVYVLALMNERGGLEPLAAFMTNPAGAAIVSATGPIRRVVHGEDNLPRRHLVVPGACGQARSDRAGADEITVRN